MRALIIDDSMSEIKLMTAALEDHGFVCEYASDGVAGEEKAKSMQPDIILMDVVMPNRNGFQTCRKLKKCDETKDIPVILVTSKGEDSDRAWGLKQGASDYLVKPFDPDELVRTVRKVLG